MKNDKLKCLGNPALETQRLNLRRLALSDAEEMYNYARNEEVARYTTWEAHESIEDARTFIDLTCQRYEKDQAGEWGIELKEPDRIVGSIGFVHLDPQNSCGSIGYALS